jgi:curli biogenesis system outer membrane secretion channel CsgG
MRLIRAGFATLVMVVLCSCSDKEKNAAQSAPPPPQSENRAAAMPDVGKVDTVATSAVGYGASAAAATSDAMKNAILQVNGATIDSGSVQVKYGLDVTDGLDSASLRATEFAEVVAQKSGGAITNFKITDVNEPFTKSGQYKVTIQANIAHFTAPDSGKKITLVVAAPRFDVQNFTIGSQSVPAEKVAEDIRQHISTALTNTGRFSVLDREINADIQNELDMITSGDAPRAEAGKLGQALTADVIWTGKISSLAYNRHARQLRTSDRELVSYSGGWAVTQKLVNVATRQIMTADSLQGSAPELAPTTMGAGIDAGQVLQNMETDISSEVVASVIAQMFPITIVSRDGNNVVLSQGGESVKVGARYAVVSMGKEMKDPQTGESLGRMEAPCCELVVDKVGQKLSYAHLEKMSISLDDISLGGLQLREKLKTGQVAIVENEDKNKATTAVKKIANKKRVSSETATDTSVTPGDDGKW